MAPAWCIAHTSACRGCPGPRQQDLDAERRSSSQCSTSYASLAPGLARKQEQQILQAQPLRNSHPRGRLRTAAVLLSEVSHTGLLAPASNISDASKLKCNADTILELGLAPKQLPQHVAVRRSAHELDFKYAGVLNEIALLVPKTAPHLWGLNTAHDKLVGHRQGVKALQRLVQLCRHWHIPCLTVYAFSSENWLRESQEVAWLLRLIEGSIDFHLNEMHEGGVRLGFMGDRATLPQSLQRAMRRAEECTQHNDGLLLTVAVSYGGRSDIARAAAEIAQLVADNRLHPSQVTEQIFASHLGSQHLPQHLRSPDLLIRTGGEQRLSNFLLYEAAYSELYFSDVPWPSFDDAALRLP